MLNKKGNKSNVWKHFGFKESDEERQQILCKISMCISVGDAVTDLLQKSLAGSGGDSCQTRQEELGYSAVT